MKFYAKELDRTTVHAAPDPGSACSARWSPARPRPLTRSGSGLLRALPPCLLLPGTAWDTPLVPLLADEIGKDEPGQEVVLDRLLDLLLIGVLHT